MTIKKSALFDLVGYSKGYHRGKRIHQYKRVYCPHRSIPQMEMSSSVSRFPVWSFLFVDFKSCDGWSACMICPYQYRGCPSAHVDTFFTDFPTVEDHLYWGEGFVMLSVSLTRIINLSIAFGASSSSRFRKPPSVAFRVRRSPVCSTAPCD